MELAKPISKSREGSWLWLIKLVSGALIIVILGVHFIVNHLIGETALLTYDQIVAYYRIPIIPIMEITFLILVVSHSLIGLRGIILDLKPSQPVLKAVDWLFTALGVVSVVYGVWLITVIVSKGAG
jgi:succinate dehydrogenase hydrophobic anchor subunit